MKKQLDGFSAKEKRSAARIIRTMEERKLTLADLDQLVEREKGQMVPPAPKEKPSQNQQPAPYMQAGEAEITPGLKCVCGGTFIIEGLCGTQMAKLGCIRLALCDICDNEVKIR